MTKNKKELVQERRLSPLRLILLLMFIAILTTGGIVGATGNIGKFGFSRAAVLNQWFAPYVDVTATPMFMFQNRGSTENKDVVLAFIVSDPTNSCTPSWGGSYTLDQASEELDLDRRIARLQQQGGMSLFLSGV